RRVVDDRDLGAVEHGRILIRRDVGIPVDPHLGIAGLFKPLKNHGQRFIGVDENSAHCIPPFLVDYQDPTPASASTVCISTLAPAAQSACVASSSSLWLMPSLQGTNTIAAGITVLRLQASWPAPEVMRRCESPNIFAAFSTASTSLGSKCVGGLRQIRSNWTSTLRRAAISAIAARKSLSSASMMAASALRQSTVKAISPGMTLREGLAITASPTVPTAFGPCFFAIASIASTISD